MINTVQVRFSVKFRHKKRRIFYFAKYEIKVRPIVLFRKAKYK